MRRASHLFALMISLGLLIAGPGCRAEPDGAFDTWNTGEPVTSTGEESTTTVADTETETDTGDPIVEDPLRFVAAGSNDAVLLAMNLDDPLDVPPPQHIAGGPNALAGMFGPTPWGAEAVTHEGKIDQLRLTPEGALELAPLADFDADWIDSVWFHNDGSNALMSVSAGPLDAPETLLWTTYDGDGDLLGTFDITPPTQDGGVVYTLGRSPDSSHAAIIVDAEPDSVWEIWLLPVEPSPGIAELVDQLDLTGIPPQSVPGVLWLHIDDQRIAYRKEVLPDIRRPVAVPLDDPESNPINIVPGLAYVYSIVWSDDGSRFVVTTEGDTGFRELSLIELDGPVSTLDPVLLTEPNQLALIDTALGLEAPGHGFDATDRVWYAHTDNGSPGKITGIQLVTVLDGLIAERVELTALAANGEIEQIVWDPARQILGFREHNDTLSWVNYIDLSAEQPEQIRVPQMFEYSAMAPADNPGFGWSTDGLHIAAAGLQNGFPVVHVGELGDPLGLTTAIELPDVESTPGVELNHWPMLSPSGDQVLLWHGTQAGQNGLIHAPSDGAIAARVILGLSNSLTTGAYLPRDPY